MKNFNIEIRPFNHIYQDDIDTIMAAIAAEFTTPIGSKTIKMKDVAILPGHKFWVAICKEMTIGTIGLAILSDHSIVLKSLFLSRDFRGKGVSKLLLDTIIKWCRDNCYGKIFLGTMKQFTAAQKFYTKNGFVLIGPTDLPSDFIPNPVDALFYRRCLSLVE